MNGFVVTLYAKKCKNIPAIRMAKNGCLEAYTLEFIHKIPNNSLGIGPTT